MINPIGLTIDEAQERSRAVPDWWLNRKSPTVWLYADRGYTVNHDPNSYRELIEVKKVYIDSKDAYHCRPVGELMWRPYVARVLEVIEDPSEHTLIDSKSGRRKTLSGDAV